MAEDRGGHACGFTNGKQIFKSAVKSYEFINKTMGNEIFPSYISNFIGHTRLATIGNKGKHENAHPFKSGNLIGVHNGSIYNYKDLKKLSESTEEVDSAILYDCIANFGLFKILPLLQGILALSYYDERNGCIYLYRHNKPLSIGYKERYNKETNEFVRTLFWASLPTYLEAIDCQEIKSIQEHTLYKIKDGKILYARNIKKKFKPTEPETVVVNKATQKWSKTPTLNIFLDKEEHLRGFGSKRINSLIDKEKEEASKPQKKHTTNQSDTSKDRKVLRYKPIENNQVPMYAQIIQTGNFGVAAFWWDADLPYYINIYSYTLGWAETYDLSDEEDKKMLAYTYGGDPSDFVQEIMHQYEMMKEGFELRMEVEQDEEENSCKL